VWLNKIISGDFDGESMARCYGVGHLNDIYTVAHCYDVGDIVKYNKKKENLDRSYNLAQCVFTDKVRDVAIFKIMTMDEIKHHLKQFSIIKANYLEAYRVTFPSIKPYLLSNVDYINWVSSTGVLYRIISSQTNYEGQVVAIETKNYYIKNTGSEKTYNCATIRSTNSIQTKRGDCGSPFVTCNNKQSKFIGFLSGAYQYQAYISMLTLEEVENQELVRIDQSEEADQFQLLFVPGQPIDLPHENLKFSGVYIGNNKPVSDTSLSNWRYSPFSDEFDEQMQPAPLSAYDERIEVEPLTNMNGEKSLLIRPNSILGEPQLPIDEVLLKNIVDQVKKEYAIILRGTIRPTSNNIDDMIQQGMNGHPDNVHCTGMELNKSAGIPWVDYENRSKKSDYINNDNGYLTFKDDIYGKKLRSRIKKKLESARWGINLMSVSSSKLKNSVIKISAVKKGKTRVFHCIPVDKIITDAALFQNFKESYVNAGLLLNHAVGTNPHSLKWRTIKQKLIKHNHFIDLDYSDYDKRINRKIMDSAFDIIRYVISTNVPDVWDVARQVQQLEHAETMVLDYNTAYKTQTGLKSGEYLTSVIGCIVNELQLMMAFGTIFQDFNLQYYRDNVSVVYYGDDVVLSDSDEVFKKFNYLTIKQYLESIGHKITPGNKDGEEAPEISIDKLMFLKRRFVDLDHITIAPLECRSIESPFVYTQIPETDLVIWSNLVDQQLDEAMLNGKEYYETFVEKLAKCQNDHIRRRIATMLAIPYAVRLKDYISNKYSF
jgi:hypothetical protein